MNNQEMQKRIQELEAQVRELLEWMMERERQQLSFPLDKTTKVLIKDAITNP